MARDMSKEIEIIINSTHDGIIAVDRDARITLFNRAAERLTGKEAESTIGRHIEEVIQSTRLPLVLETGVPEMNWQQPLGEITIITSRMPIVDEHGEMIGAFAVFRDVSDMLDLAEQITDLRETRILSDAIFNSTQDAISVVNEDGIHVSVNPAYTRVTGYSSDEVIGQPCTFDITDGDSTHLKVLRTREPVKGARIKVGPKQKDVIVDAAPIIVRGELKGSVAVIKDLTEIMQLTSELRQAHQLIRKLEAKYTFDDLVGRQENFLHAIEKAKVAASTPATVLLHGESGTGKELFAHAIHNASDRRGQKFIRVNCASLSESVLESELFGYEEGAFTGARKGGKPGLFEEAHDGTIFLDEIGIMSLNTQVNLLRVLQEHEVRRVGGTRTIPINTRVIAATNLDLRHAVQQGDFREDLFYRLNVIPIEIPALRDHPQDIPVIIEHMIHRINQEYGRAVSTVSPKALERLRNYSWPGNIRELENVLRRAIINLGMYETVIGLGHLPELGPECEVEVGGEVIGCADPDMEAIPPLRTVVEDAEARHIQTALRQAGGNRTDAARVLGVSLRNLQYKLKRYGIR
jgi:PAS domain S-box-containing protein